MSSNILSAPFSHPGLWDLILSVNVYTCRHTHCSDEDVNDTQPQKVPLLPPQPAPPHPEAASTSTPVSMVPFSCSWASTTETTGDELLCWLWCLWDSSSLLPIATAHLFPLLHVLLLSEHIAVYLYIYCWLISQLFLILPFVKKVAKSLLIHIFFCMWIHAIFFSFFEI